MCEGWLQLGELAQGFAATDLPNAQESQPPHVLSTRRRLRAAMSVTPHCRSPARCVSGCLELICLKADETALSSADNLPPILHVLLENAADTYPSRVQAIPPQLPIVSDPLFRLAVTTCCCPSGAPKTMVSSGKPALLPTATQVRLAAQHLQLCQQPLHNKCDL
jgi:hypothetical protein